MPRQQLRVTASDVKDNKNKTTPQYGDLEKGLEVQKQKHHR